MAHVVGGKGQVVIDKRIRHRLGVGPGWQVVQVLAGNHVELHFIPPEHNRSLHGRLRGYAGRRTLTEDELNDAAEQAWVTEAAEAWARKVEPN